MPVAILPDISEQHCIGCALCVEICTALGPDVLRVKPVKGVEERQSVRLLSRKMYFGWCLYWRLSNEGNILDETNGLYTRTTNSIEEECSVRERVGRRLKHTSKS